MLAQRFVAIVLLVLVCAGGVIAWRYLRTGDPIAELQARCADQGLPVRTVVLVPGSAREHRFKLLVPYSNRVLVADTNTWMFCRANLAID